MKEKELGWKERAHLLNVPLARRNLERVKVFSQQGIKNSLG